MQTTTSNIPLYKKLLVRARAIQGVGGTKKPNKKLNKIIINLLTYTGNNVIISTDLNKSKLYLKKGKLNMGKLSDMWMYYSGLLVTRGVAVDDLKYIQDLIDADEEGLLLRLPCKVGDTFWELNNVLSEPVIYPRTAHSLGHVVYCLERLGKICFLTEKEAESALLKLKEK